MARGRTISDSGAAEAGFRSVSVVTRGFVNGLEPNELPHQHGADDTVDGGRIVRARRRRRCSRLHRSWHVREDRTPYFPA